MWWQDWLRGHLRTTDGSGATYPRHRIAYTVFRTPSEVGLRDTVQRQAYPVLRTPPELGLRDTVHGVRDTGYGIRNTV